MPPCKICVLGQSQSGPRTGERIWPPRSKAKTKYTAAAGKSSTYALKIALSQYLNNVSKQKLRGSHYQSITLVSSFAPSRASFSLSLSLFPPTGSSLKHQPTARRLDTRKCIPGLSDTPITCWQRQGLLLVVSLLLWHFLFQILLRFTGIERACRASRFINTSPLHYCEHRALGGSAELGMASFPARSAAVDQGPKWAPWLGY